ncbi:hypothetical protein CTAYLR_004311 [Chrysophaeum taylorii]|uniref:inorganic diphosphatase n=1 Tax=Chrysophaeum taylorii TaxID=2483200 RepID=A0AAD7UFQ0_9STRA|nr:hypothetical protein CTAYLR_004311 [Chrysophaeum taylorii]
MKSPVLQRSSYAEKTPVEEAVKSEWDTANALLQKLDGSDVVEPLVARGAVFCGHLVADLDSIAAAIGAAELYGGTAARASEINSETEFALEYWGYDLEKIPLIDDTASKVVLVDFQQKTQLHPDISEEKIVGVIDHHALQSATIVTTKPIFVDIRPWGSVSTIVAHGFVAARKLIPKPIAGLLLCAILSDTLNLRSPTTTTWDRRLVSLLVQYASVDDVDNLCKMQFKAKSKNLAFLSPYSLVSGDLKRFNLPTNLACAFSVVETTDASAILDRARDLVPEMQALKHDLNLDLIFLAVVDISALQSYLLLAGPHETALANAAGFPESSSSSTTCCDDLALVCSPGEVSRKADFVPRLTRALVDGRWALPADGEDDTSGKEPPPPPTEIVLESDAACPGGKFVRRPSTQHSPRLSLAAAKG